MSVPTEQIRNVVLVSHQGAGKTTLTEAMLFSAKIINRMGKVDEGNTVTDYEEEEKERSTSIHLSLANLSWKEKKINIFDTPGFMDFMTDTVAGIEVAESAIVLLDAVSGVEVGTEIIWEKISKKNMPRIVFVNQIGKDNANYEKCIESLKESFPGTIFSPFAIPIGEGNNFEGIIDLVSKKAYSYKNNKKTEIPIPDDKKDIVEQYFNTIMESATEADDVLMEKYLEEETLTEEEIATGLVEALKLNKFVPVLCGDAAHNAGIDILLDTVAKSCPDPVYNYPIKVKKLKDGSEIDLSKNSKFSGLIFKLSAETHVGELCYVKTLSGNIKPGMEVYNSRTEKTEKIGQMFSLNGKERKDLTEIVTGDVGVLVKLKDTKTNDTLSDKSEPVEINKIDFPRPSIALAVIPESKSDDEKMLTGLSKIQEEDPSFKYYYDSETRQTLVEGLGEIHLEVILSKLRRTGSNLKFEKPIIKYRETIKRKADAQGKHKKQSGGRGQFADVWIKFEPLARGEGFKFKNAIFGGAVPRNYIPAVEKGLKEAIKKGVLSHSLTVDLKATLHDGSYHKVDSSDYAFQIAASIAFQSAIPNAKPIILEPIIEIEVIVPSDYTGDVMGDISTRRGKVMGMDPVGKRQKIKAQVPEGEMYRYSTTLKSMTQGRGFFTQKFSHYEELPRELTEKVAEETKKRKEELDA